jgi:hypothetical protein
MSALTKYEAMEIAEAAADGAVRKFVLLIGYDPDNPGELQKDLAHLQRWRLATDTIKTHSLKTAVGVIVTAALGALAVAFKPFWWH